MKDIIVINSIDFRGSICDGPGIRTVLFVQGCKRHCLNCHNPQTWDMNNGIKYDINELANIIIEKSLFKKITISGGEPLLQMESLEKLLVLLKSENFKKDVNFLLNLERENYKLTLTMYLNKIQCFELLKNDEDDYKLLRKEKEIATMKSNLFSIREEINDFITNLKYKYLH